MVDSDIAAAGQADVARTQLRRDPARRRAARDRPGASGANLPPAAKSAVDLTALGGVDVILISHVHRPPRPPLAQPRLDPEGRYSCPPGRVGSCGGVRFVGRSSPARRSTSTRCGSERLTAEHDASRRVGTGADLPSVGFVTRGWTVYFAGVNTDLFPRMGQPTGSTSYLCLPVAGWGAPQRHTGHLDPVRAARALELIQPRIMIPIHWGTCRRGDRHGVWQDPCRRAEDVSRRSLPRLAPDVGIRRLQRQPIVSRSVRGSFSAGRQRADPRRRLHRNPVCLERLQNLPHVGAAMEPEPLGRRVPEEEFDRIRVGRPPAELSLDHVSPQGDARPITRSSR